MVLTNYYTKILINKFPNFGKSKSLEKTILLFCSTAKQVDEHVIFTGLTRYVIDELIDLNKTITNEEIEIYNYLENMLDQLSSYKDETSDEFLFSNAICVCFLENLLNNASSEQIEFDRFIPYLGNKSKQFCKAWDQFTGVRSPGLWTDEEWDNDVK